MLDMLAAVVGLIERLLGWFVALLMLIALTIVSGQFIDRHFFDLPWDAPDQLARITVVWLCFLGTALAIVGGSAIRIDLVDHVLPPRVIAWRDVVFDVVLLGLLLVLIVKGWTVVKIGASQILLGTPFTADLPYSGLLVGVALGAFFVSVRLLRRVFEALQSSAG
jgi:TRAP-type C4-dicarboxylate transport system permease small subunit